MPQFIKDLSEQQWLEARQKHVGASEIGALFYAYRMPDGTQAFYTPLDKKPAGAEKIYCLSPYKTFYGLWMEKAGRIQPPDLSNNERVIAGQCLESGIAKWATKKWSLENLVRSRRYFSHESGLGVTRDYELRERGTPPVEIKNIEAAQFYRLWQCEGDDIVDAPFDKILQVMAQMVCTSADHGWIVACVGGCSLKRMRIDCVDGAINKMLGAVSQFWQSVREGREPEPDDPGDYETVRRVYEECSGNALPVDDPKVDMLCEDYQVVQEQLKELEGKRDLIKAQLMNRVQEHEAIITPMYTVSAKPNVKGTRVFRIKERAA